jgi:acetoin utilization protein AcuB
VLIGGLISVDDKNLDTLCVKDFMSTEVVTVDTSTTLQEATSIMVSKRIRHLPVVDQGKVVGILSDRDLRMMVSDLVNPEERRQYMQSTLVGAHASSPVSTATEQTPVSQVAKTFVEDRIGCLPIVDENENLIGIVTQTDLLKWIAHLTDKC